MKEESNGDGSAGTMLVVLTSSWSFDSARFCGEEDERPSRECRRARPQQRASATQNKTPLLAGEKFPPNISQNHPPLDN